MSFVRKCLNWWYNNCPMLCSPESPAPMVTQATARPEEPPPPAQPAHQSSFVFFFHNILCSMMYNLVIVIYRFWLMLLSHQDEWWLMCDEIYWNCSTDQLNWQSRTSWCQASSSSESLYFTLSDVTYFDTSAETLITAYNCSHGLECLYDQIVFGTRSEVSHAWFWDGSVSGTEVFGNSSLTWMHVLLLTASVLQCQQNSEREINTWPTKVWFLFVAFYDARTCWLFTMY